MTDRLDIAWIDAWRRLRRMVGPIKGGQGKGEFILPDDMIQFGRFLYGSPCYVYRGEKTIETHDPTRHPASELHDREAAIRFIRVVNVFLAECEMMIEFEKINAPIKKQAA